MNRQGVIVLCEQCGLMLVTIYTRRGCAKDSFPPHHLPRIGGWDVS